MNTWEFNTYNHKTFAGKTKSINVVVESSKGSKLDHLGDGEDLAVKKKTI